MAFITDTFTDTSDTALASHTPDQGGTWVQHSSFTLGTAVISNANRCRETTSQNEVTVYYNNAAPAAADYDVIVTIRTVSVLGIGGVIGRASSSANTMYSFFYSVSDGQYMLNRIVAGTTTTIGTFTTTLSVSTNYVLKLEMRAAAIKCYVDGVERISVTDSNITAAGFAGIRVRAGAGGGSDSAGIHLDDFSAADVPVAGPPLFIKPFKPHPFAPGRPR